MKSVITSSIGGSAIVHRRSFFRGKLESENFDEYQSSTSSGFTRPKEPVRNGPDGTGYRVPSSWAIQPLQGNAVSLDLSGTYTDVSGNYSDVNVLSGTAAATVHVDSIPNPINSNEIRMKILNNVRDEVFDVAMVLAEMSGTVSTLTGNLHRIGRSLAAFKKGNPRSFYYLLTGKTRDGRRPTNKFLRETAGSYLEWKYGIMPTVYDVQGACIGLDLNSQGELFNNPPLLVARTHMQREVALKGICRTRLGSVVPQFDVEVVRTFQKKARLDFSVSAEGLRGLNRYGIGLGTLGTVLWDKTPFTFVLDMALPIADMIKAWTALQGVSVKGYCETEYYSDRITGPQTGKLTGIPFINHEGIGRLEEYKSQPIFKRVAFRDVPMPVPFVRNPLKVGNIASVLSLFTALRKPDSRSQK